MQRQLSNRPDELVDSQHGLPNLRDGLLSAALHRPRDLAVDSDFFVLLPHSGS